MKQRIFKGWHFTLNRLFPFGDISHKVILDKSCWYENATEWNKLIGLQSFDNHKESIRIAWRPLKQKDRFQIAIYEYHKGIRTITSLWTIGSNETLDILIGDGLVIINKVAIPYDAKGCFIRSNFYFGGKDKAPHKMSIRTEKR